MWRHRARNLNFSTLAVFACCTLGVSAASATLTIAAQVDGVTISVSEVDALSPQKVDRIRSRLVEAAQQGLRRLVDDALAIPQTVNDGLEIPAVSESQIDRYRRTHSGDFASSARPPKAERDAIRFYLYREARRAAVARLRTELQRQAKVETLVPQARTLESTLPPGQVVAHIGDTEVLATALEKEAALSLYRLRGELYLERRRNLDAIIDQQLLAAEAHRRSISLPELEHTFGQSSAPTDSEVRALANDSIDGAAAMDRARPYLAFKKVFAKRTALLAQLRDGASIEVYLKSPAAPRFSLEAAAGGITLRAEGAGVLVAFTNYRCRWCRVTQHEIDELLHGDRPPQIILRDFIPTYDPVATEAAAIVRCAAHHGGLLPVRSRLLTQDPPAFGQAWFSPEEFAAVAEQIGVSVERLRTCMNSTLVRQQIRDDSELAQRLGFDQAPSFLAEGLPLSGMQTAEALSRALTGDWP